MNVDLCYGDQQVTIPLVMVKGKGPSLFDKNWLERIKLNWLAVHKLQKDLLESFLSKHAAILKIPYVHC